MATLAELRFSTRTMVGDVIKLTPTGNQELSIPFMWNNLQIDEAVNHAALVYCQKTGATYMEVTATPSAGGVVTLPGAGMIPIRVMTGNLVLDRTTKAFEDSRDPSWRASTGVSKRWMFHDGHSIRLAPAAATPVTVGYLDSPVVMVENTDVPDARIPVCHHAHLPYEAAAFLLMQAGKGQDPQRSQGLSQTFEALILNMTTSGLNAL